VVVEMDAVILAVEAFSDAIGTLSAYFAVGRTSVDSAELYPGAALFNHP
jgi:hypothetical protein